MRFSPGCTTGDDGAETSRRATAPGSAPGVVPKNPRMAAPALAGLGACPSQSVLGKQLPSGFP
jgi:hypothetical protein